MFSEIVLMFKGIALIFTGGALMFKGRALMFTGIALMFTGIALMFIGGALIFPGWALIILGMIYPLSILIEKESVRECSLNCVDTMQNKTFFYIFVQITIFSIRWTTPEKLEEARRTPPQYQRVIITFWRLRLTNMKNLLFPIV